MSDIPSLPVTTGSDDGDDDGSLFGSPPSSPARGRSPSPLALPGGSGSAQNVGALALPGSHLVAELPTNPPASLPLSASASAPSQSWFPYAPAAVSQSGERPRPHNASFSRRSSPGLFRAARSAAPPRKARKGKRAKSSTPKPTPPPISLPSADEPTPPNFLRNQQALLGLAGMVSGVHPANLSKIRHTRGATATNPIVVEDEPEVAQQPCIGKRPTHSIPSDPSQLPPPTSEQILRTLLKQKNIFPVVVSLLRLLAPSAPSLASAPPGYPHYPYPYPYPMYQSPSQGQASTPTHTATTSDSRPSSSSGAPPLKRRKLNAVPAGAADWDVPYPFQEGQGPENYRAVWERERGRQLLKDLVQLVQNAARKAATKSWYQQHVQPAAPVPTVLKYYRPATLYYGLERGQSAPPAPVQSHSQAAFPRGLTSHPDTPRSDAYTDPHGLPQAPAAAAPPPQFQTPTNQPLNAFDDLVESLLAAQYQQQGSPGPALLPKQSTNTSADASTSSTLPSTTFSPALDESTQTFFDDWLATLTAFPPGDPNDTSVGTGASLITPATATSHSAPAPTPSTTDSAHEGSMQISDDLIDPALLGMQVELLTDTNLASSSASGSAEGPSHDEAKSAATLVTSPATGCTASTVQVSASEVGHATSPTNLLPPTPSLVDSPSITVTSLADTADRDGDPGPATPSWDWSVPDSRDMEAGMKLLNELAAMDADLAIDSAMDLNMDAWEDVLRQSTTNLLDGQPVFPPSTAREATADLPDLSAGGDVQCKTPVAQREVSAPQESRPDPHASQPVASTSQTPMIPVPCAPASTATAISSQGPPLVFVAHTEVPSTPAVVAQPPSATATATARTARGKGKAKAIPGTGNGIALGATTATGKQDRRAVLERARAMRAALAREVERAKVALWETTLEQGVLVGWGRELDKKDAPGAGAGKGKEKEVRRA